MIQESLEKNLELLAKRFDLNIADARIITAGLKRNPQLSLGADHLDVLGTGYNSTNGAGPSEYSVRADYLFEGGGKRGYRMQVAELARQVTQLQFLDATRKMVLDVQNTFLDTQVAQLTLALAEENQAAFGKIVQVSTDRVRAGDLAKVELMRTRLAALQYQNAVIQAKMRLPVAKQRLQLLMGRTQPQDTFEVEPELPREALNQTLEQLQQLALTQRPDLLALRRDKERSLADLQLQLAMGRIDYTLGMEYRRQQGLAGKGNSLGLFLSVPLPIFDQNQGEVERARQEQSQIEARIRSLEADIRNEIASAWQQYQAARALVAQIENLLEDARQVMSTMTYSYRVGHASLTELLDAQRAYNETMLSHITARADSARGLFLINSIIAKQVSK